MGHRHLTRFLFIARDSKPFAPPPSRNLLSFSNRRACARAWAKVLHNLWAAEGGKAKNQNKSTPLHIIFSDCVTHSCLGIFCSILWNATGAGVSVYFIPHCQEGTLNIVTFSWYCWVLFGITHPAPISYQEKRLVWFIIWSFLDFIFSNLLFFSMLVF